jgi:hypothetical protein
MEKCVITYLRRLGLATGGKSELEEQQVQANEGNKKEA